MGRYSTLECDENRKKKGRTVTSSECACCKNLMKKGKGRQMVG